MTGTFEAEVLLELMLRFWKHPHADDPEFRNALLERTAEALRAAVAGHLLIDGLPAAHTNLIAAIWYAERNSLGVGSEDSRAILAARKKWLVKVERALPSCFCDPGLL
jgi:hypothetical protein